MKLRFKLFGLITIVILVATLLIAPSAVGAFAGGDGSEANPWQIEDCQDLQDIDSDEAYADHHFVLINDIDCEGFEFTPIEYGLNSYFEGVLDGGGFTISKLLIEGNLDLGIFGTLDGATIRNVVITDAFVDGEDSYVGVLTGYAGDVDVENVVIENSTVIGSGVDGAYLGGLAGIASGGTFTNVEIQVEIDAPDFYSVGGLAGRCYETHMSEVSVSGTIFEAFDEVGGLCGRSEGPTIESTTTDMNITGRDRVGGIIGELINSEEQQGSIRHTTANGNVTGEQEIGGFIGEIHESFDAEEPAVIEISNAEANGDVKGIVNVGGFVGANDSGTITQSGATGNVTSLSCECGSFGGFVGRNTDGDFTHGTITQSFALGNVDADGWDVGGFVGVLDGGTIEDSFARGDVFGYDYAGGFAGNVRNTSLDRTYSTGEVAVDSDVLGGHTAEGSDGEVLNSFWDEEASGIGESDAGEGLTTAEAKSRETYESATFNFNTVWGINEDVNDGYPCLLWVETCNNGTDSTGPDTDGDGISDAVENAGPNGGDANGDGILDSQQPNVASIVSPITGQYVAVIVDESCALSEVEVIVEPDTNDVAFDYPLGLASFVAECSGESTTVELRFFNLENADFVTRKFNPNNESYFTIEDAEVKQGELDGLKFVSSTYTVIDNGPLDFNSEVGKIYDPAGLGSVVVGAPRTGAGGTA